MNFDNTEIAFRHKSDKDLRRSKFLFGLLAFPWLVSLSKRMLLFAMRIKFPVNWIVKPTVYRQFVGGVSIMDCHKGVRLLERFKVKAILDYSVEGGHDERQIEATLQETLKTIENATTDPNIPFAVFKPTAFGNLEELQKIFEYPDSPFTGHPEIKKYICRVDLLCKSAFAAGIPIMIDAEDSWYQGFVDWVVTRMMQEYNKDKAIVFNTLQMYRYDRLEFLKESILQARQGGYFYGVKFVRGAYMEKERQRAELMGYPSPIHPDKDSTDKAFNDALTCSIENIDMTHIFCGTHNEESCLRLIDLMKQKALAMDDPRVWFSQLYGMGDQISFNLAHEGYNVAKYLPYGPVKHVMPYLFRRAEENTSIAGQTGRELRLLTIEIKRRGSV
jgi:proline dehydrogenase